MKGLVLHLANMFCKSVTHFLCNQLSWFLHFFSRRLRANTALWICATWKKWQIETWIIQIQNPGYIINLFIIQYTFPQSPNNKLSNYWDTPLPEMSASLVRRASRRFTDPGLDVSDLAHLLSPFQIEKLSFLFKCLDQSGTGFIDVGGTLNS